MFREPCQGSQRVVLAAVVALCCAGVTSAQTLSRTSDKGQGEVGLLTQADVTVENNASQVGLQAVDLFINKAMRLYLRTTLPIAQSAAGSQSAPGQTGGSSQVPKLSDAAVSGLLDPYGGVLNLTGGYWRQIAYGHDSQGHRLETDGLFLDTRFGLKLINLRIRRQTRPPWPARA